MSRMFVFTVAVVGVACAGSAVFAQDRRGGVVGYGVPIQGGAYGNGAYGNGIHGSGVYGTGVHGSGSRWGGSHGGVVGTPVWGGSGGVVPVAGSRHGVSQSRGIAVGGCVGVGGGHGQRMPRGYGVPYGTSYPAGSVGYPAGPVGPVMPPVPRPYHSGYYGNAGGVRAPVYREPVRYAPVSSSPGYGDWHDVGRGSGVVPAGPVLRPATYGVEFGGSGGAGGREYGVSSGVRSGSSDGFGGSASPFYP